MGKMLSAIIVLGIGYFLGVNSRDFSVDIQVPNTQELCAEHKQLDLRECLKFPTASLYFIEAMKVKYKDNSQALIRMDSLNYRATKELNMIMEKSLLELALMVDLTDEYIEDPDDVNSPSGPSINNAFKITK